MRRWTAKVIFVISIVLLAISIYSLMGMFHKYREEEKLYDDLQRIHELAQMPEETGGSPDMPEDTEDAGMEIGTAPVDEGLLALHRENPDCIYWIRIPDTVVDYPVMYRPQDKNYYLHRDFYGNALSCGTLYLDEDCDPKRGDNLIIYGHHMNSGSMFAVLDQYKSRDFYEAHPLVELQTLHGEETYRIMAVFTTPVYTGHDFAYYGFTSTGEKEKYDEFVEMCRSRSLHKTGVTAVYGQRLLTLSTCEYSQKNGRMVVVAVRED